MLTITGNGMGGYTFDNLTVDTDAYDVIICDKNFKVDAPNVKKLSYSEARSYILEHYAHMQILYVVTGSPFFYSAGILLAKQLPKDAVKIIDNTSSLRYMQATCHFADAQTAHLSIHGRAHIDLEAFLTKPYTFILCDEKSIEKVRRATAYLPKDALKVTIGYKLGYPDEQIAPIDLAQVPDTYDLRAPYVLLIERCFTPMPSVCSDDLFATERGMITKQYKRHLSLQHLDLAGNQLLWDVGAGSGSCAIEAYKRYRVRTVLFEKQPQRCDFIRQNLHTHYVCDTQLIEGDAQTRFDTLTQDPDRIFVGGGGEKVIARLPYLYERLTNEGVMLINAITLKNLTQMIQVLNEAKIAYKVISLSLTTYKGSLDLIEPERQLFQIKVCKGASQ